MPRCLALGVVLAITLGNVPTHCCTVIYEVQGDVILAGNNEDYYVCPRLTVKTQLAFLSHPTAAQLRGSQAVTPTENRPAS